MAKKEGNEKEYLEKMWHTTAHVFAEALTETYPEVKIAIGPPIEEGFHYDFELDEKIEKEDLKKIEKTMKAIVKRKDKMVCEEKTIAEAKTIPGITPAAILNLHIHIQVVNKRNRAKNKNNVPRGTN